MVQETIRIPEDIYNRAIKNQRQIVREDYSKIFTPSLLYGYGIYRTTVFKKDSMFYCVYTRGSSCD